MAYHAYFYTHTFKRTLQKQEELQFAVGAAVADLACSGPLRVPAGKLLEDMRPSALAARREMKEEKAEQGAAGTLIDALDYVLYQVGIGGECRPVRDPGPP